MNRVILDYLSPHGNLYCNNFSRIAQKVVLQTWFFFSVLPLFSNQKKKIQACRTRFLEPDFLNYISKNCKHRGCRIKGPLHFVRAITIRGAILIKIRKFIPENGLFQGYFTKISFDTSEENKLSFFQNYYFSKFFGDFVRHMIR